MFYAIDELGNKVLPKPNIKATCPCCNGEVIAKCGKIKVHHWSHKSLIECDQWYEMTAWHLEWQSLFPLEFREVVLQKDGIKHRADIKINNLIVEFQHSNLSAEEIKQREVFYTSNNYKLIWVVNASNNRVHSGWENQLGEQDKQTIYVVDIDSNIYFELVGYSQISVIRKTLSLPISIIVNPDVPVFIDLGEYVACPVEKGYYDIERTSYNDFWGRKRNSDKPYYDESLILVRKKDFVELLPKLPTNLDTFTSLKFCDKYTFSKREEHLKKQQMYNQSNNKPISKDEKIKTQAFFDLLSGKITPLNY
ncbi:hypothetical protein H6G91_30420 [Nostoc muscorum FACHB-395]|jgi:hypothetical protein|nr:hypothetical protein [Desmonostoc muscorum FACHB-395]